MEWNGQIVFNTFLNHKFEHLKRNTAPLPWDHKDTTIFLYFTLLHDVFIFQQESKVYILRAPEHPFKSLVPHTIAS